MATAKTVRARPRPPHRSGAARDRAVSGISGSAVSICLKSVVLALPLAMLDGALSPYIDPKAWALHLLAAGGVVAWIYQRNLGKRDLDGGSAPDPAIRFLRWVVLAYGAWWVVATAASVTVGASLWGNFGRADGLLTRLAAIALYFLVQAQFRSTPAAVSLVDLALLGSVPVVLIALGQALGWDPMPTAGDPVTRTRSTFGQHVLLGGYLVFVIPLVTARLGRGPDDAERVPHARADWSRPWLAGGTWALGALVIVVLAAGSSSAGWACVPWGVAGAVVWTVWIERGRRGVAGVGGSTVLAALLVAQILTVILSGARAAFLGMLIGLSVAAAALLLRARAWRGLAIGAAGLGAVLIVLLLLNVPGSPLRDLRRHAPWAIARLGTLADVERGSGRFRVQLWGAIISGWVAQVRGHEVIVGFSPRIRSAIGYGPESQLATLDRLYPPRAGSNVWMDRAHNELLDHLVTGGLVGAGLWLLVAGAILAVGVRRLSASASPLEASLRAACLGAIVAHLVDAQFGIATPVSRAFFWIVAGLLTLPPPADPASLGKPVRSETGMDGRRRAALILAAILAALVVWASTRWLMASVAYADGSRRRLAGDPSTAHSHFQQANRLVPGLSQPADAVAAITVNLAARETDPTRQRALLTEAEDMLAHVRSYSRYASNGANHWALVGQIALARARGGEVSKLRTALGAYATAARLKPDDASILSNWSLAWLEAREPTRARAVAARAVALKPDTWLAWAVLARASAQLGDTTRAQEAAARARALAPLTASGLLGELLP